MKIKLSLALVAVLSLSARSEIMVYKATSTITRNGNGASTVQKWGGFTLIDSDTADVVDIDTYTVGGVKKFAVHYQAPYTLEQVAGLGKSFTVFNKLTYTETESRVDFAKGQNSSITFNGKNFLVPRRYTTWSRGVVYFSGIESVEANGTLVIDLKRTALYDQSDLTLAEIVNLITADLLAKGYLDDNAA